MRRNYLVFTVFLFILNIVYAQKTPECFTDIANLVTDNYKTLGIFEYTDGSIWFVTEKGVSIFNKDGTFSTINKANNLVRNPIGSYLKDSKDRVWIGTGVPDTFFDGYVAASLYKGGFIMYDGEQWRTFRTDDLGIDAPLVTQIYETSSGDLWFVVKSSERMNDMLSIGGLLHYKNGEWNAYKNSDFPCLGCKNVDGLREDSSGKVWFWSDGSLFYFYDGKFSRLSKDTGHRPNGKITAVYVDSGKNLWLGSGGRIGRYDGSSWKTFTKKDGLPPMLYKPLSFVEMPDRSIVMIAQNGLYHYRQGESKWKAYKFKSITANNNKEMWQYSHGFDGKGNLWVAHRKNIVRFDGQELYQEKKNLRSNLLIDNKDNVWAPTRKGVEIYEDGQWTVSENLKNVFGLLNNDGAVWALTKRDGIWRYDNNGWSHYSTENGLLSNNINMGYVAKNGDMWISTTKGICRFIKN